MTVHRIRRNGDTETKSLRHRALRSNSGLKFWIEAVTRITLLYN